MLRVQVALQGSTQHWDMSARFPKTTSDTKTVSPVSRSLYLSGFRNTVLYSRARKGACHSRLRLGAAFVLASSPAEASLATATAAPTPNSSAAAAGVAVTAATAAAALRLGVAAFLLKLPLPGAAAQLHMGHACTSCCLAGQCCEHNKCAVVTGGRSGTCTGWQKSLKQHARLLTGLDCQSEQPSISRPQRALKHTLGLSCGASTPAELQGLNP
jgi:hypothetical protein